MRSWIIDLRTIVERSDEESTAILRIVGIEMSGDEFKAINALPRQRLFGTAPHLAPNIHTPRFDRAL